MSQLYATTKQAGSAKLKANFSGLSIPVCTRLPVATRLSVATRRMSRMLAVEVLEVYRAGQTLWNINLHWLATVYESLLAKD